MYDHILVCNALDTDHVVMNEPSTTIAQKLLNTDGQITLLHVLEEIPSYVASFLPEGTLVANRASALEKLRNLAGDIGKNCTPAVTLGHSSRSILDYAEQHDVDCIVIASHRPGIEDYFLGSTAGHVVRHATCAVHVLR